RVAAVRAAEARVAYSREALAEAGRERERTRELYDRTLLSDHDLQIAGIAWLKADFEHRRALARLAERQLALEHAELRAPYPALVLQVPVAPGQTVVNRMQATPMVVLARSDRMRATADLSLDQLKSLRSGQTLQVKIDGLTLDGVLVDPGLAVFDKDGAGRYSVEVEFDWPAQRNWRAGQPAEILLP
ncbi:MAG: HlyD family efflux transporter periplasmic adaptor subunit, partial [Thiogranum sp.]|nr:HlyD family efflux transporter periplasmic adaptor subunit [Thiogranum sp.]